MASKDDVITSGPYLGFTYEEAGLSPPSDGGGDSGGTVEQAKQTRAEAEQTVEELAQKEAVEGLTRDEWVKYEQAVREQQTGVPQEARESATQVSEGFLYDPVTSRTVSEDIYYRERLDQIVSSGGYDKPTQEQYKRFAEGKEVKLTKPAFDYSGAMSSLARPTREKIMSYADPIKEVVSERLQTLKYTPYEVKRVEQPTGIAEPSGTVEAGPPRTISPSLYQTEATRKKAWEDTETVEAARQATQAMQLMTKVPLAFPSPVSVAAVTKGLTESKLLKPVVESPFVRTAVDKTLTTASIVTEPVTVAKSYVSGFGVGKSIVELGKRSDLLLESGTVGLRVVGREAVGRDVVGVTTSPDKAGYLKQTLPGYVGFVKGFEKGGKQLGPLIEIVAGKRQLPPTERAEFEAALELAKKRTKMPDVTETQIQRVKGVSGRAASTIQKYLSRTSKGTVLTGSVAQETQSFVPRELGDVDAMAKNPEKLAQGMADALIKAGVKGVKVKTTDGKNVDSQRRSGKVFIEGKKVFEYHHSSWREAFPYLKKPRTTPSGVKVIDLREQLARKAVGGYLAGRGKDIKDISYIKATLEPTPTTAKPSKIPTKTEFSKTIDVRVAPQTKNVFKPSTDYGYYKPTKAAYKPYDPYKPSVAVAEYYKPPKERPYTVSDTYKPTITTPASYKTPDVIKPTTTPYKTERPYRPYIPSRGVSSFVTPTETPYRPPSATRTPTRPRATPRDRDEFEPTLFKEEKRKRVPTRKYRPSILGVEMGKKASKEMKEMLQTGIEIRGV